MVLQKVLQLLVTQIPTKTRDQVLKLYFENGLKAKDIGRWLRNNISNGFIELKDSTINNLVGRHKKTRLLDDPGKSIEALINWAQSRSAIPDDDDAMFVVAKFNLEPDNVYFHIFMTTKRLISITKQCDHIATDGTYKLTWINFPVLFAGTTDKGGIFIHSD